MREFATRRSLLFALLIIVTAAFASCAQEQYPASMMNQGAKTSSSSAPPADASAPGSRGPETCVQARSTPLPQRLVVLSGAAVSSGPTEVLVDQVFAGFVQNCGNCHGPTAELGNYQLPNVSDFKAKFTQADLNHAKSNGPTNPSMPQAATDPNDPMPPFNSGGEPFKMRSSSDPVYQFVQLAQTWIDSGKPESFTLGNGQDAGPEGGAPSPFALRPDVGNAMTNLGDCIPSPGLVGAEQTKSAQLDAMFAALQPMPSGTLAQQIGLPEHLADTDMLSFDTRTLARYGVVAYAPTYPLWSDDAGLLRYVRVPRGASIQFHKATQQFTIPTNTRFYQTFMKRIADADGSIRWRKIETRLIVSQPDTPGTGGEADTTNAIFGTYVWTADESDAVLLETPMRSGAPWVDTLIQYNTDEQLAADLLSGQPFNPEQALLEGKAARHYAIPAAYRCGECHSGSASASFVLGFAPLQLNRRPAGVGGVIEAPGPDELTQLQRLIDYGVVTGIDSIADILPLEKSEGTRAPRNNFELVAQGYLLGNCAHCHNPRGNPSIDNPVLGPILNFLPGPEGGIFQYPLERYSPRIPRGVTGGTIVPYITPSLMDQPDHSINDPSKVIEGPFERNGSSSPPQGDVVYGPWRSLIFRDVDTAFSYTDDYALFPHMPEHTAGYDPRVKQIVADWMVSIPAVRKHPELSEYTFCASVTCDPSVPADPGWVNGAPDETPQPYVEVLPGDPRYDQAVKAAEERLSILHTSSNALLPSSPHPYTFSAYQDPGDTGDMIDPATIRDPVCNPVPTGQYGQPPRHPQWVVTDESQLATYSPLRPDWTDKLVEQHPDTGNTAVACGLPSSADTAAFDDEVTAVALLQNVTLSQDSAFRTYATTPVPFGLWHKKPGCNFTSQPTVGSLSASSQPPLWVSHANAAPTDPVYSQSPGAAVYKSICTNCHGPLSDGGGRIAGNLADMTGGLAVPADFLDGFMGPVGSTDAASNRHLAFGPAALPTDAPPSWTGVTDEDRAARYLAWMSLGGTRVTIPQAVLQIVSLTEVLGQRRPYLPAGSISANMLSTAKAICLTVLNGQPTAAKAAPIDPTKGLAEDLEGNQSLIRVNGDAEAWFNLCTKGHSAPVRVLQAYPPGPSCAGTSTSVSVCEQALYSSDYQFSVGPLDFIAPASYPAGAPVGNAKGGIDAGLSADNQWPWCVVLNGTLSTSDAAAHHWPVCPTSGVTYWATADANSWALRGAINAGLAVYLYLEYLEAHGPDPDYDQCDQLLAAPNN